MHSPSACLMQYVDVFAFMSQQTVQRCRCRIGAMSYALRIRIMHHSAASARGRAMDYALRIRIMHQAPKVRRRGLWTTHCVSVLCIKRRKPAGEGYVLRITYPYYVGRHRAANQENHPQLRQRGRQPERRRPHRLRHSLRQRPGLCPAPLATALARRRLWRRAKHQQRCSQHACRALIHDRSQ